MEDLEEKSIGVYRRVSCAILINVVKMKTYKILLTLLLFCPLFSFSQYAKVDTTFLRIDADTLFVDDNGFVNVPLIITADSVGGKLLYRNCENTSKFYLDQLNSPITYSANSQKKSTEVVRLRSTYWQRFMFFLKHRHSMTRSCHRAIVKKAPVLQEIKLNGGVNKIEFTAYIEQSKLPATFHVIYGLEKFPYIFYYDLFSQGSHRIIRKIKKKNFSKELIMGGYRSNKVVLISHKKPAENK